MGRAPCCDKMGVKKGPWTAEEDRILSDFIHRNGHGNWRALPKEAAGLLRCGKSCRLRWINYLRPDIKRGNFSYEEEEAIIKLHQHLGNRWSAIASRLPGRTDNEIKNVWNTHLKKRLLQARTNPVTHSVEHNQISLDYSECRETSPSVEKDMVVHSSSLTQQEVSVDYPTTNISSSDYLSAEIFSSPHNEAVNSDSTLNCIQLGCNDSFDIELGYQQYPITTEDHSKCNDLLLDDTFIMGNQNFVDEEKNSPRQSSEDLYFISACQENDVLNDIDGANSNTHLLWNGEFQAYDDDCDSMVYWLSILGQAGPSPML